MSVHAEYRKRCITWGLKREMYVEPRGSFADFLRARHEDVPEKLDFSIDSRWEDHTMLFRSIETAEPCLYLSEPYQLTSEGFRRLTKLAEAYDFEIFIAEGQLWNPGRTIQIELRWTD